MLADLGTEKVLMDERMSHIDGSVSARYAHVAAGMRRRLLSGLTGLWEASIDARLAMCPTSPVAALDRLLRAGRRPPPGRGIPRSSPKRAP